MWAQAAQLTGAARARSERWRGCFAPQRPAATSCHALIPRSPAVCVRLPSGCSALSAASGTRPAARLSRSQKPRPCAGAFACARLLLARSCRSRCRIAPALAHPRTRRCAAAPLQRQAAALPPHAFASIHLPAECSVRSAAGLRRAVSCGLGRQPRQPRRHGAAAGGCDGLPRQRDGRRRGCRRGQGDLRRRARRARPRHGGHHRRGWRGRGLFEDGTP